MENFRENRYYNNLCKALECFTRSPKDLEKILPRWTSNIDEPIDEHITRLKDLEELVRAYNSCCDRHKFETPNLVVDTIKLFREILKECLPNEEDDRMAYLQKLAGRSQLNDPEWKTVRAKASVFLKSVQALGYCTDEELKITFISYFRDFREYPYYDDLCMTLECFTRSRNNHEKVLQNWYGDIDAPYDEHADRLQELEDWGIFFYRRYHEFEAPDWFVRTTKQLEEILSECLPNVDDGREFYLKKLSGRSQLNDPEWEILRAKAKCILERVQEMGYCSDEEIENTYLRNF